MFTNRVVKFSKRRAVAFHCKALTKTVKTATDSNFTLIDKVMMKFWWENFLKEQIYTATLEGFFEQSSFLVIVTPIQAFKRI